MNPNNQLWIFISLILLAIIIMIVQYVNIHHLQGELGINKSDLKKKDKTIEAQIDSIEVLRETEKKKDQEWTLIINLTRDSLHDARQEKSKWRKKYEQVKNMPVPAWSDHELDSIIRTVIR
jgi:predicted Holliday junction resolvase-like endonuclease